VWPGADVADQRCCSLTTRRLTEPATCTYAGDKSREAMLAASGNVRGYRDAKLVNSAAATPVFTAEHRAQPAEE
jgi:hypothetical protein